MDGLVSVEEEFQKGREHSTVSPMNEWCTTT